MILASNRYGFQIDQTRTNAAILDRSSMQVLTIFLGKCKITSKMSIDAQFLCQQKYDGDGLKELLSENEIRIMKINGSCVHRVGGSQTTLQIYIKTGCGEETSDTLLNRVRSGIIVDGRTIDFSLILKLMVQDESGYIGAEDTIELKCIPHNCPYDVYLARQDSRFKDIVKDEVIQDWGRNGELTHSPCNLCDLVVSHARKQYLSEVGCASKGKRRVSTVVNNEVNDFKRSRNSGNWICYDIRCY
jgi:hypothetical protein